MKVNPYLMFDGCCREAFQFYESCMGGKILGTATWADMPPSDEAPSMDKDKVMHIAMQLGDSLLMGSDCPPPYFQPMSGMSVNLTLEDIEQGERIFNTLADGGKVEMPFAKTFWAERFGSVTDRFGTPWMINCGVDENCPEE